MDKKGFTWLTLLYPSPSLRKLRVETQAGTQRQKPKQRPWKNLLTGLFPMEAGPSVGPEQCWADLSCQPAF